MFTKKFIQILLLTAIVFASFAVTGSALAWSGCGSSYVVQWGDSLGSIANNCGTSVAALRLANPNMGYWIYAGQTLWMPGAYYDNGNGYATYTVARGDSLKSIAARYNTTMDVIANLNGIYNYNLIYVGQQLSVPAGGSTSYPPPSPVYQTAPTSAGTYVVQWGDTMRKIADRMGINVNDLIAANPQLWNPSLIYAGQVLNLPQSASFYCIQQGDTLKIIAARYGTTVNYLLAINPQIWNADWIYVGQVIRVW